MRGPGFLLLARAAGACLAMTSLLGAPPLEAAPNDASFRAQADAAYREHLESLKGRGLLDLDAELVERARAIMARLLGPAAELRPESRAWKWEIHVSGEQGASASCIAGGKMIVGAAFVRRLALTDPELAMLLAHEMAHALAGHRMPASRD